MRIYRRHLCYAFALLILGATPSHAETKTVTMRTYFPPPIAGFDRLRLVPTIPKTGSCPIGAVYMCANAINFCRDTGDGTTGYWTIVSGGIWLGEEDTTLGAYKIYLTDNKFTPPSPDRDNDTIWDLLETQVLLGEGNPVFRLTLAGDGGDNDGGILASGSKVELTYSSGFSVSLPTGASLTTTGPGTRFFWYPKKAALRAGTLSVVDGDTENTGDNWDDTEVGVLSVALGRNSRAAWLGSMIHGGENNQTARSTGTSSLFSTILSGHDNRVLADFATIGGGGRNSVSAPGSIIGGGEHNIITTSPGTQPTDTLPYRIGIGGGRDNYANQTHSAILGGFGNRIESTSSATTDMGSSFIGGGGNNKIYGPPGQVTVGTTTTIGGFNTILGGHDNYIGKDESLNDTAKIAASTIGGGGHNKILVTTNSRLVQYAAILGGGGPTEDDGNIVQDGTGFIGGGRANMIIGRTSGASTDGTSSVIVGGEKNMIFYSTNSGIVGGHNNFIRGDNNFIGGGQSNRVSGCGTGATCATVSNYNAVGGGQNNWIDGSYSFIGGGRDNWIRSQASYSAIPGGGSNSTAADYSLIAGKNMNLSQDADNTFVWGYADTPLTISDPNNFVIFPNAEGNVGIGTATPQHRFHVVGGVRVRQGLVRVYVPGDWTPTNKRLKINGRILGVGTDLAETFETSETVEPGDLLVMDTAQPRMLRKSLSAYDRKIVGIVSATPGLLFEGSQIQVHPKSVKFTRGTKPPIALKGRVMVKVSIENGSIKAGDALTSSSLPGHAMKATDASKENGAILGKALGNFKGGPNGEPTGLLPVFVALH